MLLSRYPLQKETMEILGKPDYEGISVTLSTETCSFYIGRF